MKWMLSSSRMKTRTASTPLTTISVYANGDANGERLVLRSARGP